MYPVEAQKESAMNKQSGIHYLREHRDAGTRPVPAEVTRIRDTVVAGLGDLMQGAFDAVDDSLFELANKEFQQSGLSCSVCAEQSYPRSHTEFHTDVLENITIPARIPGASLEYEVH